ncbi:tail fiber assembly protein [Pantoea stewartii subsp. stewartii]|nr:tail fiber assembly protein [Pantoea stewartii]KAB0545596.1 tail fiber assembly protein [Pantoea stewartii subsp. stewartii]
MMSYVFSPATNGFFLQELEAEYHNSGIWPADGIEVSDEVFVKFSATPPEGKMRGVGSDSMPVWIDIPPPTQDELVSAATITRQALISQANTFMNSRQWPGKAALGRLKEDDLALYNKWLDYLDALYAVDLAKAPQITWPIKPD